MQYPQRIENANATARFWDVGGWQDFVNGHFPMLEMSSASRADFHASAARLSAELCVSRRSLYALLARNGLTPARLITEIRLQYARDALETGRHKITDIAFAHGFADSARFSRAFEGRFGLPPSVWRTRHGT